MSYTPITAFRRLVDATQLKHAEAARAPLPPQGVNKWEVLRELTAARAAYGLSDRELTVLEALVSFHPATILGGNEGAPVVHPSNHAICERLKGMPCSTMRRHLARLIAVGLVVRRDSPNGKRYVRRTGDDRVTFGFDLSPLVQRHGEICAEAEAARASADASRRLRETVSLMRRDLAGLAAYGAELRPGMGLWDQLSDLACLAARDLRRKLDDTALEALEAALSQALEAARNVLDYGATEDLSTNPSHIEQRHQNSNTDLHDSEPCFEKAGSERGADMADAGADPDLAPPEPDRKLPNIPLGLVLGACHEIATYSESPIRHWHQFVNSAEILRPMMGISPSAWTEAKDAMGPEEAAVVLAAMLERFTEIKSPGGYLRALTLKALDGKFSCGPMIMALMRKAA